MNTAKHHSVAVHCEYFKKHNADAVLDHSHSQRNGFTSSQNVHSEYTHLNSGLYFHNASSCSEALEIMMIRHKEVTGKKVRVDNNVLFEHVVVLSESQYSYLEQKYTPERVKKAFMAKLKEYALAIKKAFGFEPLGIDSHFDEGTVEKKTNTEDLGNRENKTGFKRNIHAHVQFMNFSFSPDKMFAPLRHLYKKGKDINGKTRKFNPHFEKIQDIAYAIFRDWGFKRGHSRNIYKKKHLKKEDFVKQKLSQAIQQTELIQKKNKELSQDLNKKKYEKEQLESILLKLNNRIQSMKSQVVDLKILKRELSHAVVSESRDAVLEIENKVRLPENEPVQGVKFRR